MNVSVADVEITPIELEIIYNALTAAAAEMDVTIWRTSRSTIVRCAASSSRSSSGASSAPGP